MKTLSIFFILLLLCISIHPQTQTTLTDLGRLSTKTLTTPAFCNGSATYQNYLYVSGGHIYIYNNTDTKNPTFIKTLEIYSETGGARRIWIAEKYLFLYTGSIIRIYDLSDPENPVLKSRSYVAGADLHKVSAKGNYMFVLYMTDTKTGKYGSFEIVDITDPVNPQLKGTYKPENYEGRSFYFSETANRVFVVHYDFATKQSYIRELDYSDPTNPTQVRELIIPGASAEISINGTTMFVLKDAGWQGPSKLEAYNIDVSPITQLASLQISTESAWDMHVYGNSVTVTLLETNGFKNYTWNGTANIFENGVELNIANASQISWFKVTTEETGSVKTLNKTFGGRWVFFYYTVLEKASSSEPSETLGWQERLVEAKIWEEVPDVKVALITSINPGDAAADGCTVTPTGSNQYDKNSNITLNAQAGSGWVFDKWTGSINGAQNPQDLVMDNDKNIVGNFQPILILGLTAPADNNLCPSEQNEELTVATANISADGVAWLLTGISFTAVEKIKPDYTEAWIEYNGTKLKGTITTDADGYATSLSFSPNKQIDEGTTLALRLFFKFDYPSQYADKFVPKALIEIKKYKVSIHVGQVTCEPIPESARPGIKTPSYPPNIFYSNTQTVASVWNVSNNPNLPFATIQDAVSSSSTSEGEIIQLCPCEYDENVKISKALTIKSVKGKSVTYVSAKNKNDHVFELSKSNTTIKGLTIFGSTQNDKAGIYIGSMEINNTLIDSSIIADNFNGIRNPINTEPSTGKTITVNNSIVTANDSAGIYLSGVNFSGKNLEISNNSGTGISLGIGKITLEKVNVSNNIGVGILAYDGIRLEGFENYIGKNKGGGLASSMGDIVIDGVEIVSNSGGGIFSAYGNIFINCNGSQPLRTDYVTRIDSNGAGGIFTKTGSVTSFNLTLKHNGFGFNDSRFDALTANKVYLNKTSIVDNNGNGIIGFDGIRLEGFENYIGKNMGGGLSSSRGDIFVDGVEVVNNSGGGIFSAYGNIFINCNGNQPLRADYVTRIDSNGAGGIFTKTGSVTAFNLSLKHNGYGFNDSRFDALTANKVYLNKTSIEDNNGNAITGFDGITLEGFENYIGKNKGGGLVSSNGDIIINGVEIVNNSDGGIFSAYGNIFINCNGNQPLRTDYVTRIDSNGAGGIWANSGSVSAFSLSVMRNGFSTTSTDMGKGIAAGTAVYLRKIIVAKNKYHGLQARNVLIRNGLVSYNGGWGVVVSGNAGESDLDEGVNIGGNILGGVWFQSGLLKKSKYSILKQQDTGAQTVINNSSISNNIGDGVKNDGAESFGITNSNIFENNGTGVLNSNSTANISAINNWWGASTGPSGNGNGSGDEVSGNVLYSNWKSKQISLVSSFATDSMFVRAGQSDSVEFSLQNFTRLNDQVKVTISDSLGWIISGKYFNVSLKDSVGGNGYIKFAVPMGTTSNTINKIRVAVESTIDSSAKSNAELLIITYSPALKSISIKPDSVKLAQGRSTQFYATGFDQFNKELNFDNVWNASGGNINSQGYYTAGDQLGNYIVTVKNTNQNVEANVKVKILSTVKQLSKILIYPDSLKTVPGTKSEFYANGLDQFDSTYSFRVKWSATGGTIDSDGVYTAGASLGSYYVAASDSSGTIYKNAVVIISDITDVKDDLIPKDYSLSQNYPNPFNPITKINYSIPMTSHVKITMFNILGQAIVELVNDEKLPGNYYLNWNADKSASGIYFCRIVAANSTNRFVKSIKMVLLK